MTRRRIEEQASEAFGSLAAGELERFLDSCADDLVLEARGIVAETTYVPRGAIAAWYAGLRELTGGDVESTVRLVQSRGERSTVVVRHAFERDGAAHSFDMVNICAFSEDVLSRWTSFPLNVPEFALALGLGRSVPEPA